jgi:hypothetical protein
MRAAARCDRQGAHVVPLRGSWTRAGAGLGLLAAAVVVAGCGGSASASGGVASIADATATAAARTTTTSNADREALLTKAAQCMRDHGVKDFPDPTVDAEGNIRLQGLGRLRPNDPATRTAFQACQSYFRAARPQFSPAQRQKLQDALL